MAQPSTSAAANSGHDVFINHRGPDSKKTFASHLYRRLLSSGLTVFLDQPELQRGDDFSVHIEQEIRSASVHVAIFSEGYADSRWCLDELVQMLDTKAPIIPVFYHVKPDELRGTRGKKKTYAEALDELAKKTEYDGQTPRHDPSEIQKWRDALREVAKKSGFELEACNGDEGKLLDQVVDEVLKRVKKVALPRDVGKYPTGLDEKVEDFEKILLQQQQSGKPQILGIVGLGGIGKTTLATEFFNRKRSDYSRSCFFSDVKDNVKNKDLIKLQKKLLDMFNVPSEEINRVTDVAEGKEMIRKHISSSFKALLVIDDVDHDDQVDALLPHTSVIDRDSLVLITSRNRQVLRNSNVEEESIYTLSGLSEEHSLELFCSYSFHRSRPPQEFESLVNKFLEACGGLPLSLKVFAALLHGKNISYWEDQLDKFPIEIMGKLKISYDALEKQEKEMFLDIACFFIGEDRDMVVRILGEGFQNIQDRCLVEVDPEKKIRMHDHLRDMGRELAKASELPRRLWRWTEDDMYDMLQQSSVTDVRGLRMVDGAYTHIDDAIRMRRLQFLDADQGHLVECILTKVQSSNLIWLRWNHCPFSSLSSLPFRVPMEKLRVLHVQGFNLEELWKKESETPLQLRELQIEAAPLFDIPKSIGRLKRLEWIAISPADMFSPLVRLKKLPEEFCLLQSLKYLVLESCYALDRLPNSFGNLTNLQRIQLVDCRALQSLPESFGNLSNLQQIQLVNCIALQRLPESFGNLTNLLHIKLYMCSALERLPDSFGKLIKLQYLHLKGCINLTMSSETLGDICTLEYINLNGCRKIEVLPTQVAHQRSLEQLSLRGTNLKELPSAIGELSDLKVLEVGGSLLEMLPPSVCGLNNLKELKIQECKALNCLPASLGDLKNLKELSIFGCDALNCLPASLGDLKNLKELRIGFCDALYCLPASLGNLNNLKELSIQFCDALYCLPASMGDLKKLKELTIESCKALKCLPASKEEGEGERGTLNDLNSSTHNNCILPGLQWLYLSHMQISEVSFLEGVYCCNLQGLSIKWCDNVVDVGTLPNTLTHLSFERCSNLRRIDKICGLAQLQSLYISDCTELEELPSIETLISLTHLTATGCRKLKRIRGLGQLTKLQYLHFYRCLELQDVEDIQHLMSLTQVDVDVRECPYWSSVGWKTTTAFDYE